MKANESTELVIIGTGGMAKEVCGLLQHAGYEVLGFVSERDVSGYVMNLPILGNDEWFLKQRAEHCVIANGTPNARRKIHELYKMSAHIFPLIIHPGEFVLQKPIMGGGTTIMPGGVIQPDVRIGRFTHINMGVTVGHDVTIGEYCVINHNAGISGNVKIGNGVLVGAGSVIIENNTIGDGAIVGAGAVVTKDVPAGETWAGVPAKPLYTKRPTMAELYEVAE